MKLTLIIIPQEIVDTYKLLEKENNGYIYIQINKGVYGMPQSGRLANNLLFKHLAPHEYNPVHHTHGLWKHAMRPIIITLVVDDFRTKHIGKEHTDHLINSLKQDYEVTEDWMGKLYCGIMLD
jgi:hypothetical protein